MNPKKASRRHLAEFVTTAVHELEEAFHFTVRGNNEMSLSTLTMLTREIFAATLIVGGFVKFKRWSGELRVSTSKFIIWDEWLLEHELSYLDGYRKDVAEMSHNKVSISTFKHCKPGVALSGIRKEERFENGQVNLETLRRGQGAMHYASTDAVISVFAVAAYVDHRCPAVEGARGQSGLVSQSQHRVAPASMDPA